MLTDFSCAMLHSYPYVALLSLRVLVPFTSNFLCESGFQLYGKLKQRQEIDWMSIRWDWLWCTQNQEFQNLWCRCYLSHHINNYFVIFVVLRLHFCPIFILKCILCNALFLLLMGKKWGVPTFLLNLKRVATKKRWEPLSLMFLEDFKMFLYMKYGMFSLRL